MHTPKSLKSLTFAILPKSQIDPVMDRRNKTILRLEEQKHLFNDPTFTRTVRTPSMAENGSRTFVEKQQRVLPWWVTMPDGSILFTIRSGWKPIELDKGKSAIVVLSKDKLPSVVDMLIYAVQNGELDEHLAQARSLAGKAAPTRS